MAKIKSNEMRVIMAKGEITLDTKFMHVDYINRKWLLKFNPCLIFPAFRRENKKIIYVNGKRIGYAETRDGIVPLYRYTRKCLGRFSLIKTLLRNKLGLLLRSSERGYFVIRISRFSYIVTKDVTASGFITCEIYDKMNQDAVGRISFSKDLSEAYVQPRVSGVTNTLQIVLGYISEIIIYSSVAESLNKVIDIKIIE